MHIKELTSVFMRVIKTTVLMAVSIVCFMQSIARAEDGHWTTTWATATEGFTDTTYLPPKPLAQNTMRMFVRTSVGGELLRFRFSNAYGTGSVGINAAHFALAASVDSSATSGDINTNTDTTLKFRGAPGAVIPPGGVIYSDPVKFSLPALSLVAISVHYGEIPYSPMTGHRGSRTTSYVADGNAVSAPNLAPASKKDAWWTLTGIEVMAPMSSKAVFAMGDSITDGNGTLYNYNTRWTDFLATRLATNGPTAGVGVGNMGIGATGSGLALTRFRRDVLDQSAARWVVIFIGVNDIIYGNQPVSYLTNAYTSMASQAHTRGLKVYGATITPMGNAANSSQRAVRQNVNTWIRTTAISNGIFDALIDFDATMRDPSNAEFTLPAYANDDLHMKPAGYEAMGNSIDLNLFVAP
jgi:lysophospholipase L1-like esterase